MDPKELPDYPSTKGAINTFPKSLAQMLIEKGIRVNALAPGRVSRVGCGFTLHQWHDPS